METAIKAQIAGLTAIKEDTQKQIAELDVVKMGVQNRTIAGQELPDDGETWAEATKTQMSLSHTEYELTMAINALGRI